MNTNKAIKEHLETYPNSELKLADMIEELKTDFEDGEIIENNDGRWECIPEEEDLTIGFMRRFADKLDWNTLVLWHKLPVELIEEFQDKFNWDMYCRYGWMSEEIMRRFTDKLDWRLVSMKRMSEDFIREFQDMVVWDSISMFQDLTEDFIMEFEDRVNWETIHLYQHNLSEDFIETTEHRVIAS